MDESIKAIMESATNSEFDLENVAEFRSLLRKLRETEDSALMKRQTELASKLQSASFNDLKFKLDQDVAKLVEFYKKVNTASAAYSNFEVLRKRQSYNAGVLASTTRMATHVKYLDLEESMQVLAEYNAWKTLVHHLAVNSAKD